MQICNESHVKIPLLNQVKGNNAMVNDSLIREVWRLTCPANTYYSNLYFRKLQSVLALPKKDRFRTPFSVKKPSGGTRTIVPATADLVIIHQILTKWVLREHYSTDDYCYSGAGIINAVKNHVHSQCGLVVDLKSAFDQVTRSKLQFALQRKYLTVSPNVINVICDLLTYPVLGKEETTPQGCVSTPYFFNAVMFNSINILRTALLPFTIYGMHLSRYSDNIAISFDEPAPLKLVAKAVRNSMEANAFPLSHCDLYPQMGMKYLGILIHNNRIDVCDDKGEVYLDLLTEAIHSEVPLNYYPQIKGIKAWLKQIYGTKLPGDLYNLLNSYFTKVKRQPKDFVKLRAMKLNYMMS